MRNYLLAGTSALALTLAAGAANAQTAPGKFDIKLGGDAYFEAGFVGQDKAANTKVNDFANRFRLTVNPVATADNGLTYGIKVRIRANYNTGLLDGDQAYIYVSGTFGTVQAGVIAGPSDLTYVAHPQDWQMLGIYDQWRSYMSGSVNTTGNLPASSKYNGNPVGYVSGPGNVTNTGTKAAYAWGTYSTGGSSGGGTSASEGVQLLRSHDIDTKLVYYTPRFFGQTPTTGLQGGFSYAPRNGDASDGLTTSVLTDVNRSRTSAGGATALQRTNFDDVYELTFNYVEKWGPWMLKLGGGYEGGSARSDTAVVGLDGNYKGLESFQVGAQIGFENFILGGGYVYGGDSGYTSAKFVNNAGTTKSSVGGTGFTTTKLVDQTAWNVGVQYTWAAWVFGVKYLEETDAGNLAVSGDRTLGALTLGTLYTVAPGLRTGLEYTHFSAGSEIPGASDNGDVVLLRSIVTF